MKNKKRFSIVTSLFLIATLLIFAVAFPVDDFEDDQNYIYTASAETGLCLLPYAQAMNNGASEGKWIVNFGLAIDKNADGKIDDSEIAYTRVVHLTTARLYSQATISVRTRDGSAVASLGDYVAYDNRVGLIEEISSTTTIEISNAEIQVNGYARSFFFEVYNVEVFDIADGLTLVAPNQTPATSIISLTTNANIKVNVKEVDYSNYGGIWDSEASTYSLKVYSDVKTHRVSRYSEVIIKEGSSPNRWDIDLAQAPNNWFRKVKYMADAGMIKLGIEYDATAYEDTGSWFYVDNCLIVINIAVNPTGVNKQLATWYIKFQSDEKEYLGLENNFNSHGDTFEGLVVSPSFSNSVSWESHMDSLVNILQIGDIDQALNNGTKLTISVSEKELYKTKIIESPMHVNFIPINYGAKILSTSIGKLRIDENGKPKIGMSARFSEPMQIKKYSDKNSEVPVIEALVNNASQNSLNFEYVSGDGSDTFYFEADASAVTTNITSLKLKSTKGFGDVYDICPDASGQSAKSIERTSDVLFGIDEVEPVMNCSFDFRVPRLDAFKTPTTAVSKSHVAQIQVENISTTGFIRYAWTDVNPEEQPTPPEYLNTIAVNGSGVQTISSPSEVSGVRWLYVNAVSDLGKTCKEPLWMGPFYFDNDAPKVDVTCTNNGYKSKDFEIKINNNSLGLTKKGDLSLVSAIVTSDEAGENIIAEFPIRLASVDVQANEHTFNLTITAEQLGIGIGETQKYGDYYISFIVKDSLENVYESENVSYYYDVRDVFDVSFSTENRLGVDLEENIGGDHYVTVLLKPSEAGEYDKVTFTSDNPSTKIAVKEFVRISDNKQLVKGVDFEENITGNVDEIIMYNHFTPGLYSIVFKDTSEGSSQESFTQYLYATMGTDIGKDGVNKGENTAIYVKTQKGTVLVNSVYQLFEGRQYHYADENGAEKTEYYGGTSLQATFSSSLEAYNYVYFYELQDLYAIRITENMANDLNQGIYKKADGVTEVAKAGQVWIRYKNANWRASTTTATWVYYYYSDGVGASDINPSINERALSEPLKNALSSVAKNISNDGSYEHLVLDSDLDKYGAPKLDPKQMHIDIEYASESKCKTPFVVNVEYTGDNGLYVEKNIEAPLSSNVVIGVSEHSRYFYKTSSMLNYKKINNTPGMTFAEYFRVSGKYQIIEFDEKGVREFAIYVDVDAPKLKVSWSTQGNGREHKEFSKDNDGQIISGTNFYIEGIVEDEYDEMAYVSIYEYHSQGVGTLIATLTNELFNITSLKLPDGIYYVKVSDRSGNGYIFRLQINSEKLVCKIREVENTSIEISVNRSENEVIYQVYLDGSLITTNYNEKRFYNTGAYQFYIEDIYGNVYDEYFYAYEYERDESGNYKVDTNGAKIPVLDDNGNKIHIEENGLYAYAYYIFEKDLPTLQWRYKDKNGNFVPYKEGETNLMNIIKDDETTYTITTSTTIQFRLQSGCAYEVLSGYPNETKVGLSEWLEVKNLGSFSLMVYYEKSYSLITLYNCIVDTSPPVVSVSYYENTYDFYEYEEIKKLFDEGKFVEGSNDFVPSNIGFYEIESRKVYLNNDGIANSRYFFLDVSDESGISQVDVYLDDELFISRKSDFSNIMLSRYGKYTIIAVDRFGNETKFSFTNGLYSNAEYFVDGEQHNSTGSIAEWFDHDNKTFNKIEYGHSHVDIKVSNLAEIYYLITGENGEKYYVSFVVDDGKVYQLKYVIDVENVVIDEETGASALELSEIRLIRGMELISLYDNSITQEKQYIIWQIEELGLTIYVSLEENEKVTFSVKITDDQPRKYTVETRIVTDREISPYYVKTEFSNTPSSIDVVQEDGEVTSIEGNVVRLNQSFKISPEIDDEVSHISVSYSHEGWFENFETVYDGTYYDTLFNREGMYLIRVQNVYGIAMEYTVIVSSNFTIATIIQFADETKTSLSSSYTMSDENEVIYSNRNVEFIAYSPNVKASINGEEIVVTVNAQGYSEIYVDTVGVNDVVIWDEYGNCFEKKVEICLQTLSDVEDVLIGFNDNALRRDENYTNQKISVQADKLTEKGIFYVALVYGDNTYRIYDEMGEESIPLDIVALTECVGKYGDGEYKLVFRDCYGNKAETIINYCGTPTLSIMRTTLNSISAEVYPLENISTDGVWTNDLVKFVVTATEYSLKVDGLENVMSIDYDTKTKNEYSVTYIDEYGFYYQFKVHMLRQNVYVEPSSEMKVLVASDTFITKDNVCVTFTENAICTYVYNNSEEIPYQEGDKLYKDGMYRFKVVDVAGNTSTYTIEKDSIAEYRIEGYGTNEVLINGGVTNSKEVTFIPLNSDSVYIKKAFHNGVLVENVENNFAERGKWELVVADEVGNESYFRFHIIYGKMENFTYDVPYNYLITSVEWELHGSSVIAMETVSNQGRTLTVTENGNYNVIMQSEITGDEKQFYFTIDNTPPQISLEGCEENEKTINNVTIKGCEVGDTINVYKDGTLIKTVRVDSSYADIPVISEGGKYDIVVENEAGVSTTLSFERKYIPNVAGSVLIIVISIAVVIGLLVGLIWRNHSKTDE